MASGIGVLESRTVRTNIITTTFVAFVVNITRRATPIVCPLRRCCIYFSNRNLSDIRTTTILEEFSLLILKTTTNPNWAVFGIGIIIFHQTRVFEIIIGFNFIVIGILIRNILIGNIT